MGKEKQLETIWEEEIVLGNENESDTPASPASPLSPLSEKSVHFSPAITTSGAIEAAGTSNDPLSLITSPTPSNRHLLPSNGELVPLDITDTKAYGEITSPTRKSRSYSNPRLMLETALARDDEAARNERRREIAKAMGSACQFRGF